MSQRPLAISFPPSSLTPKAAIDPLTLACADLTLKRLKSVSRRLSATLTSFQDEFRLLERLFYKGKNQHRISLFWRHLEEVRRLCNRLMAVDLMAIVARVRHAFYNSTNYDNNNLLKLSWTHLPSVHSLRSIVDTLGHVHPLLTKMSDRLLGAYCSFKRVMQTGAFLQLVLTLSALTCRLRALSVVLLEINEALVGALRDLCNSIEISPKSNHEPETLSCGIDTVLVVPSVPTTVTVSGASGRPPDNPATVAAENPVSQQSARVDRDEGSFQRLKVKTVKSKEPADQSIKPQLKKKKKRLDEIDAIFGS